MSETANIAAAAEEASDKIFSAFFWNSCGVANEDWPCVKPGQHNKRTHPSDVVFFYNEPYRNVRTYVNCDLKSYAKGTITWQSISAAVRNLALAVDCAENNPIWQNRYCHDGHNSEVVGLLFVYNHDGEYDGDFAGILKQIPERELAIPSRRRVFVLGPQDICFLNTIATDIRSQRGMERDPIVPAAALCSFYYPELHTQRLATGSHWQSAATLEHLTGPWLALKTRINSSVPNYDSLVIYYRESGATREEFLYMIDYLYAFQQIQDARKIYLRLASPSRDPEAVVNFNMAKQDYSEKMRASRDTLNKIICTTVTDLVLRYSTTELGMRNE